MPIGTSIICFDSKQNIYHFPRKQISSTSQNLKKPSSFSPSSSNEKRVKPELVLVHWALSTVISV